MNNNMVSIHPRAVLTKDVIKASLGVPPAPADSKCSSVGRANLRSQTPLSASTNTSASSAAAKHQGPKWPELPNGFFSPRVAYRPGPEGMADVLAGRALPAPGQPFVEPLSVWGQPEKPPHAPYQAGAVKKYLETGVRLDTPSQSVFWRESLCVETGVATTLKSLLAAGANDPTKDLKEGEECFFKAGVFFRAVRPDVEHGHSGGMDDQRERGIHYQRGPSPRPRPRRYGHHDDRRVRSPNRGDRGDRCSRYGHHDDRRVRSPNRGDRGDRCSRYGHHDDRRVRSPNRGDRGDRWRFHDHQRDRDRSYSSSARSPSYKRAHYKDRHYRR